MAYQEKSRDCNPNQEYRNNYCDNRKKGEEMKINGNTKNERASFAKKWQLNTIYFNRKIIDQKSIFLRITFKNYLLSREREFTNIRRFKIELELI